MSSPPAQPSLRALGESLAALAARFEDLARTVADALDAASPRGPAAPSWIDLDRDTYHAQLADLRRWADTVLRTQLAAMSCGSAGPATSTPSGNYPPWPPNGTASTAATVPTSPGPVEFYDRWLPGTMRRITDITRTCIPQCVMLRGPGDWIARPGYH
jgi:hypothetical protein